MVPGVFAVLEGIDGSGKSTTALELSRRLAERSLQTVVLREPTEKTDASREIRRILRTVQSVDATVSRELLELFLIDRLWDLKHQIMPALKAGQIVLLDRYFLSTAAYQSADSTDVQAIMQSYLGDERIRMPDVLIHLTLPVEAALMRLEERRQLDVFETETRLNLIAHNYGTAITLLREVRPEVQVIEMAHALADEDFEILADRIAAVAAKKKA
ncbi:MAG: dTMP kinase [Spirochaetota bacterium]